MQSRTVKNGEREKAARRDDENSRTSKNSFPPKVGKKKEYDGQRFSRTNFSTASVQSALEASEYADRLIASEKANDVVEPTVEQQHRQRLRQLNAQIKQLDLENKEYEEKLANEEEARLHEEYLNEQDRQWCEDPEVEELNEDEIEMDQASQQACGGSEIDEKEYQSDSPHSQAGSSADAEEEWMRETSFIPAKKDTRSSYAFNFSTPAQSSPEEPAYTTRFTTGSRY